MSLALVRALPRKAVSRAMGVLARTPVPRAILVPVLAAYARGFGVDLSEAARPLSAYATFDDFFARELRPGARPLDPDPLAALSPVDGRVHAAGSVEQGAVLQAKGVPYALADLLGSREDAETLEGGTFVTAYLSPRDYHRIHWPFDGEVVRVRHLPGDLWPVHPGAVDGVPRLFARNERVAVFGRTAGGAPFAMVPVGALNVGSIRLAFHPLRTNRGGGAAPREVALPAPVAARRGAEAGRFLFGSAVVLVLGPGGGRLDPLERGARLRQGARVGTLTSPARRPA